MENYENIPLPKLPGTDFYDPLDMARPRPQVFKVVNGIAGNYGEVSSFDPGCARVAPYRNDKGLTLGASERRRAQSTRSRSI